MKWSKQKLYENLHREKPLYGKSCGQAEKINHIAKALNVKSIFDFGAAHGVLLSKLKQLGNYDVSGYDFAAPESLYVKKTINPSPVDMVVSTDVLEHVPKEELALVWSIFKTKSPNVMFHRICCRPATQVLGNGENAHATVEKLRWWRSEMARAFSDYFIMAEVDEKDSGITNCLLIKKKG